MQRDERADPSATWANLGLELTLDSGATILPSFDEDLESWVDGTHPLPRLQLGEEGVPDAQHDLQLVGVLGEGGMGTVYLAEQRSLQRQVAVKRTKAANTPSQVRQMLLEARYTGSLEHPNVIPVHGLGLDDQRRPVLIMKRVEGTAWLEMIHEPEHEQWATVSGSRIEWHVRVLIQVANAVHFAHSRQIFHRDIKPENVMIGHFGEVYLLDWGVALDGSRPPSDAERMVGTPAYMAPELTQGDERLVTCATDVYLLGACLHEVLTGHAPHRRADGYKTLMAAWDSDPQEYPPAIPQELAEICRRAMAREQKDRYASALALRRALETFLTHLTSIHIAAAARRRLAMLGEAVESKADDGDVQREYAAARFGFEQALDLWSDSVEAGNGRTAVIEKMAGYALGRGELGQGERLLGELENPPGHLVDRVAQLRVEAASKARELDDLREMQRQQELSVTATPRFRAAMVQTIMLTLLSASAAVLDQLGIYTPGHIEHVGAVVFLVLSSVFVLQRFGAEIHRHQGTRRLTTALSFMVGGMFFMALFSAIVGLPLGVAVGLDMLLIATSIGITSVLGEKFILITAAVLVAAGLLCAVLPGQYLWILTGVNLVMPVTLLAGMRLTGTGPHL